MLRVRAIFTGLKGLFSSTWTSTSMATGDEPLRKVVIFMRRGTLKMEVVTANLSEKLPLELSDGDFEELYDGLKQHLKRSSSMWGPFNVSLGDGKYRVTLAGNYTFRLFETSGESLVKMGTYETGSLQGLYENMSLQRD